MVFKDEDPDMRELAVLENEVCLSKIQELRQKVKRKPHSVCQCFIVTPHYQN